MINNILGKNAKVENKRESEIAYESVAIATVNANLAVAISCLKTITHDPSMACNLTKEQLDAVQKLIGVFK